MSSFDEVERDVESVRLPRWGRVVPNRGGALWLVVDPGGEPVAPVDRFLVDFVARGNCPGSVRSYAYDLLRWWRWLRAVDVGWDRATSAEVRDFVLWLGQADKPRRSARTASAATAGTVNPVTRKQHLDDRYQPRTVRHSNAVLRAFYAFCIERGEGPVINPVPLDRRGRRPNAHHNPMEPFRPEGRIRYNNRVDLQRWVTFRSHYGFDAFYCRPGIEGAHEKGGLEGEGGRFRRNPLMPMPRVGSIAELNELRWWARIDALDDGSKATPCEKEHTVAGGVSAATRDCPERAT